MSEPQRLMTNVAQRIVGAVKRATEGRVHPEFAGTSGRVKSTVVDVEEAERRNLAAVQAAAEGGSQPRIGSPGRLETLLHPRRTYRPSSEEKEMRRLFGPSGPEHRIVGQHDEMATAGSDLERGAVKKQVYRAESTDGARARAIVKPFTGEIRTRRAIFRTPGAQGAREVGMYRLSNMLGWDRVPPAALVEDAAGLGPSAVMKWVRSHDSLEVSKYDVADQHRMAVLDYIGGNSDRNPSNFRTVFEHGRPRPVAIDHSLTFPEYRDAEFGISSEFIGTHMATNAPLHADVLRDVRALHPDALRSGLRDLGMSADATEGAVARLREIQTNGRITGEAWHPGKFI
ncbi:hypothetical protein [Nocardia sp. NBC_00511]|uniref:hypothetical protein n=1 Tax=Nocardia sp. NBC_00511 TaxID=2903591 RepID=UPI0030DE3AE1